MKPAVVLVSQLAGLVVVAGALAVVTGIIAGPVVVASTVGAALVMRHLTDSRVVGAEAQAPGLMASAYDICMPVDRMAVGPAVQLRFLPPARGVWAAGMLCAGHANVGFIPSKERHADRAWSGPVDRVEVRGLPTRTCIVRAHGPGGSAQFIVQQPADVIRAALGPYVALVEAQDSCG
jgi:hypothetical protein